MMTAALAGFAMAIEPTAARIVLVATRFVPSAFPDGDDGQLALTMFVPQAVSFWKQCVVEGMPNLSKLGRA